MKTRKIVALRAGVARLTWHTYMKWAHNQVERVYTAPDYGAYGDYGHGFCLPNSLFVDTTSDILDLVFFPLAARAVIYIKLGRK